MLRCGLIVDGRPSWWPQHESAASDLFLDSDGQGKWLLHRIGTENLNQMKLIDVNEMRKGFQSEFRCREPFPLSIIYGNSTLNHKTCNSIQHLNRENHIYQLPKMSCDTCSTQRHDGMAQSFSYWWWRVLPSFTLEFQWTALVVRVLPQKVSNEPMPRPSPSPSGKSHSRPTPNTENFTSHSYNVCVPVLCMRRCICVSVRCVGTYETMKSGQDLNGLARPLPSPFRSDGIA